MSGRGSVMLARDKAKDRSTINKTNRANQAQAGKRGFWGGMGRGLLGLAGAGLFGVPGAGIGSFLGDLIGRKAAGDYDEVGETSFYQDDVDQINSSIRETKQNEMANSVQRAMMDAFTAYSVPNATNWLKKKFGMTQVPTQGSIGAANLPPDVGDAGDLYTNMQPTPTTVVDQVNVQAPAIKPGPQTNVTAEVQDQGFYNPADALKSFNELYPYTPPGQAINQNPYLQNTGSYVSPMAQNQWRMQGLLEKATQNQGGKKYGS